MQAEIDEALLFRLATYKRNLDQCWWAVVVPSSWERARPAADGVQLFNKLIAHPVPSLISPPSRYRS
jgi:hypothetical protein